MKKILELMRKDWLEFLRDKKTFVFFLGMPLAFMLFFGFVFRGGDKEEVNSMSVGVSLGWYDLDQSIVSQAFAEHLQDTLEFELVSQDPATGDRWQGIASLEQAVFAGDLVAAVAVPDGFEAVGRSGTSSRLVILIDHNQDSSQEVEERLIQAANRLQSAIQAAQASVQLAGNETAFLPALQQSLQAWETPPLQLNERLAANQEKTLSPLSVEQTSPGMMLQFALAGLLTAAQILVNERKSGTLQRLLTGPITKVQVIAGHYLAILGIVLTQFVLLLCFAQWVLGLGYLRQPLATLLVMVSAAMCITGLGLLIGVLAETEEQVAVYSLVPMFVFSGLGGAWVPLEITGRVFQTIGHFSPIAWAMDGFKNISVYGMGLEGVWLPSVALLVYAILFLGAAVGLFYKKS